MDLDNSKIERTIRKRKKGA